jgi:cbb3-type cytochrome oxidase maturation protein
MNIIVILICISLSIALAFLGVFLWAFTSGQYEDTYTPSIRMLFEDKLEEESKKKRSNLESEC